MPESLGLKAAHTLCLWEVQTVMLGSVYPGRTQFTAGRRGWLDLRVFSCRELREAGVNLTIFPSLWVVAILTAEKENAPFACGRCSALCGVSDSCCRIIGQINWCIIC